MPNYVPATVLRFYLNTESKNSSITEEGEGVRLVQLKEGCSVHLLCMIHQGSLCPGFSTLQSLQDIIKTEFFRLSRFNHYWLYGLFRSGVWAFSLTPSDC